jgi:aldose 1-epimerase
MPGAAPFRCALDARASLGECPVWSVAEQVLYWVDINAPALNRFDPPRAVGDLQLDNVFTDWRGRAVLRRPAHGLEVALTADRACPFLVVYVPPGRDFVALEPVTHMTDAFNRAARGERGTGTRTLEPGAVFSCTMQISVRVSR